ncbi:MULTISPECIES: DUF956 family protein [Lactiplantibacillus]|uniref:Regulator of the mannose operon ManO n=3 Tax=Lactiplantibacillus TaxID=2767842 RepID=F9UL53_LACPL|nr:MULTISPECIES: DUF956 family protein [Lactiplantibacillus]AJO73281.1 hypothetical protein SH83_02540 [Lactiplantibacillus plantarum]ARO05846.1 hypothetical protein BIZ33_02600 [Lactiplantibacillus plantarum]KKX45550.1 hypothetical protein WH27_06630 [Lactiplantibacillus plantarum]KZU94088.1 putative regulator of the mannose operon ManO [Lactiplantibacillus plantarum]MBP5818244.1 DUF956 family protein [Lactiplantibacillus plantarum]
MVESLNTKVELVIKGNSHLGLTDYGQIMVGDKGFEFYDERNVRNYIQIPWAEVDSVVVSIMFKGRWIPRYALKTKKNGMYAFSSKNPKRVLRAIRKHVDPDKIVRSLTFFDVLKRAFKGKNRDNYLK